MLEGLNNFKLIIKFSQSENQVMGMEQSEKLPPQISNLAWAEFPYLFFFDSHRERI